MGRKKIDTSLKLPEGKINSTFKKRKLGVATKAKELGVLCDVDVAVIAFHPGNNRAYAISHGGRINEIINKFHNFKAENLEKIEFDEVLREPPHQLQHQMHSNIQVQNLSPPTIEMEIGTPVGQPQGFDIQAQGNNSSQNDQQQLLQNQLLSPTIPPTDFDNNYGQ